MKKTINSINDETISFNKLNPQTKIIELGNYIYSINNQKEKNKKFLDSILRKEIKGER